MRKRIRSYLAIGAGAALVLTGLVPAAVVTQAVAAEPATIEVQPSALPAGTTFTVTNPGDSGAGTFAEAIDLANLESGPSTIVIAAGIEVTVTQPLTLKQSITIQGSGGRSVINWAPEQDDLGNMLYGEDVTMQVFDVEFKVTAPSMEPLIQLSNAIPDNPFIFKDVSLTNLSEGGVEIETALGGVLIDSVTVAGTPFGNDYSEGSVFAITELHGGLTMKGSSFSDTRMAGLILNNAELAAEEQILIVNNSFQNIDAQEVEANAILISIDMVEADDNPARAAVHVEENRIKDVTGRAMSGIYVGSVYDGVMFANNTVENTNIEGNTLQFTDVGGAFGDLAEAVVLTGNTFSENIAAEGSILQFESISGTLAFVNTGVHKSESNRPTIFIDGIDHPDDASGTALNIDGLRLSEAAGFDANSIEYGFRLEDATGIINVKNSEVAEVTADIAAFSVGDNGASVSIANSKFINNLATGAQIEDVDLDENDQITVSGSEFSGNSVDVSTGAAGLEISALSFVTHVTNPIEIRDSSFMNNEGGLAAGLWMKTDFEFDDESITQPGYLVDSSTFWNPSADRKGLGTEANDMYLEATGEYRNPVALTLRNSTFEARHAVSAAPESVVANARTGRLETHIEHVTMTGGNLMQTCSGEDDIRLNNSAVGAILENGTASAGCAVSGSNNTVVELGSVPASAADVLPVAEWKVGELFDNGGPTQTLMPAEDSPLIDSAAASNVLVDQRGVTRPQGAAPDRGAVEREVDEPVDENTIVMGPDVTVQAGKPAVLTVKRLGDGVGAATAVVELQDGTAKDGDDYFANRFELSWADGDTADKTIQIETIKNKAGSRAFTATITEVSGAAEIGDPSVATVTITQDAVVPVKPVDPTKPLVNTGGEAPWPLWALGGVLIAAGVLALRAKLRGAAKAE